MQVLFSKRTPAQDSQEFYKPMLLQIFDRVLSGRPVRLIPVNPLFNKYSKTSEGIIREKFVKVVVSYIFVPLAIMFLV
jgi:hypothetical protein